MPKLGLHGTVRDVYAVICVFTEHGHTWRGSCAAVAELIGSTRENVNKAIAALMKRGLITCVRNERNGRDLPEYSALIPEPRCDKTSQEVCQNVTGGVTDYHRGCDGSSHNNINNNKDNNKVINIIPSSGGLTESVSEANTVKENGEASSICSESEKRRDKAAKARPQKNRADNSAFEAEFDALWELYPRKQGRAEALAAYIRARRSGTAEETVRGGIEAYKRDIAARGTEPRFIKQGGNWFAGRCWDDEPNPSTAESGMENAREKNARGNGRAYYPPAYAARRYGIPRALNYPQHIYTKEELTAMGISLGEELYED